MLATLTKGSQISATQEEEFVGHTPAPSTEHVATESTEPEEEEFVLPHLRFQDEILSEVGLMCLLNMFELINFKTPKKNS